MSPLTGIQRVAPDGLRAFDANTPLTADTAAAFHRAGYRAAIRYVRQSIRHEYDISIGEAEVILAAGLALGIVQHVKSEGWTPTPLMGTELGSIAARETSMIGVPPGVNVWCDLEGVKPGTSPDAVIGFLNNWWSAVAHLGYLPGLYVGWHPGISAHALYYNTRFQYFWAAYNLNADQYPERRGVCMQQGVEQKLNGIMVDPDACQADNLGNRATFLAPSDFWPET